MPPKGQTQKDVPLPEDSNPAGVDDDVKASSLVQMQNTITYLSEVWSHMVTHLEVLSFQKPLISQSSLVPSMMHPQSFTMLITSTTSSAPIPSSCFWTIPQWEENRCVSILEVTNNSVECARLLAWVDNIGWMMETDGKSNWDEWVAVFKDAALLLEWAVTEQRSLHCLQFSTACNGSMKGSMHSVIWLKHEARA
ncbi:hypothetical protein D1P53_003057 [Cryptococcus gattii VGV]|nr:hypothetical protein D1P53_003057 [Cryptococcus gattii VGV]